MQYMIYLYPQLGQITIFRPCNNFMIHRSCNSTYISRGGPKPNLGSNTAVSYAHAVTKINVKYMSITFQHIMEMSMIHILSSIFLGERFHMSRKGGTGSQGEVGGFPQSVKTAWPCPSLTVESTWLALD